MLVFTFFIINHPTIAVPFMGISIQTNPLYSHIFTKYLKIISGHLAALFRQTQQREQESLADLRREPWEYHWNTAKTHQDTKSYCKLGGFVRFNELVLRIFQEHLEESSFFPHNKHQTLAMRNPSTKWASHHRASSS